MSTWYPLNMACSLSPIPLAYDALPCMSCDCPHPYRTKGYLACPIKYSLTAAELPNSLVKLKITTTDTKRCLISRYRANVKICALPGSV